MNVSHRQLKLRAFAVVIFCSTLALQSASVTISPGNTTILVGQTQQLRVTGASTPSAISAGEWHTCVLFADQSVRCVGRNSFGQIGDGTANNTANPIVVTGLANPVSVQTGDEHTCALIGDGTIQCWGTNYTGQLGDGTLGGYSLRPQPVHGLTTAISVVPGGFHTCALLSDRTAQCWGRNQDGQVGNGDSTTDVTLPVAVRGLAGIADLAAGWYHTCALMPNGTVQCWGRNVRGQVGTGTVNSPITTPTPVSGLTTAVAVAPGGYHTCALLQNGIVQCWGQNDSGQIGTPGLAFSSTPVTVNGIPSAVAISSGFYHSCAILANGTVWCWGLNQFGELGDGTVTTSATPVQVVNLDHPIAIDAGGYHTCALMADSSIRCWGENDFGEFGNGTVTNSPTPQKMNGTGLTWTSSDRDVATIDPNGLANAVGRGTTTITATDAFGNSGTTTLTVKTLLSLAVLHQGDGSGTVSSDPAGINCGATCSASFLSDSQVTLTASPGTDSSFTGWTGCDSVSGTTCTVAMSNTRSVTAIFMLKRFTLAVNKTGLGRGTVTSGPVGIDCGSACASDYVIGTNVTLTASPSSGSVFVEWIGCDTASANTCTVAMNGTKSVTANFDLQRFPLTVTINKTLLGNGTVTSSPAGISCGTDCSESYVIGTTVTLTAHPSVGSVFTGWRGCTAMSGGSCTVLMNAQTSVSASFLGVVP